MIIAGHVKWGCRDYWDHYCCRRGRRESSFQSDYHASNYGTQNQQHDIEKSKCYKKMCCINALFMTCVIGGVGLVMFTHDNKLRDVGFAFIGAGTVGFIATCSCCVFQKIQEIRDIKKRNRFNTNVTIHETVL